MSSVCYTENFDGSHIRYATCRRSNLTDKKTTVELLERLNEHSDIWVVQDCDTDEIFLIQEYQLHDLYYYG